MAELLREGNSGQPASNRMRCDTLLRYVPKVVWTLDNAAIDNTAIGAAQHPAATVLSQLDCGGGTVRLLFSWEVIGNRAIN